MTTAGDIGVNSVGVTINSVDVVTADAGITYEETPRVFEIFPDRGSTQGGGQVWITGRNFKEGRTICAFGTSHVSATFVSSDQIICTTPAVPRGVVTLTVVNSEADAFANEHDTSLYDRFFFHFHPPSAITTIEPTFGPQDGNIAVFVYGNEFLYSDHISCEFGESSPTRATWISPTRLKCIAPAHTAGNVSLSVKSFGDQDSESNSLTFTYNQHFNVTHITPASASAAGGTVITVHGAGFVPCTSARNGCW